MFSLWTSSTPAGGSPKVLEDEEVDWNGLTWEKGVEVVKGNLLESSEDDDLVFVVNNDRVAYTLDWQIRCHPICMQRAVRDGNTEYVFSKEERSRVMADVEVEI